MEGNIDRDEQVALYHRYLERCNQHKFEGLGEFVAADVGGSTQGLANYIAGCSDVATAFPDYRWSLQHMFVDRDWLAARLIGTGTHAGTFRGIAPTGRIIRTQELVLYRFAAGKIAECWGDLHTCVCHELLVGN